MHNFPKIIAYTLTMLVMASACAESATSLKEKDFAQGNTAYESEDYQQAIDIYNEILASGFVSWELYYNLGNAYYRQEQIGKAILNYERALRLAPNKQIIKDNLELAGSKTTDNIEQLPKMFLVQWMQNIAHITTIRGWRIIVLALIALSIISLCIFFISKEYTLRRKTFVISVILLFFTIISGINAAISQKNVTNRNEAVVIDPMIVVKGSPDVKSVDKFIIHEGTLLTITDRQDDWWQISLSDGKSGWINNGAEII